MTRHHRTSTTSISSVSFVILVWLALVFSSLENVHASKRPTQKPSPAPTPLRVSVPNGTTFANEAWGFPLGGKLESDANGRTLIMVDLDQATSEEIAVLRQANHIVQCYFSVGTSEHFRFDYLNKKKKWKAIEFGPDPNWPDESWIDFRQKGLAYPLIRERFLRAKAKGCQALELDNVDCYDNKACKMGGTRESKIQAQIVFNTWQVNLAHSLGLAVSLKNAIDLVPKMASKYDFAVNEQCFQYDECKPLHDHFVMKGKAVLHVEYRFNPDICAQSKAFGFASKRCPPQPGDSGLCAMDAQWTDCGKASNTTLPPVKFTDGVRVGLDTSAPTQAPTGLIPCPPPRLVKACPEAGRKDKAKCLALGRRLGKKSGGGSKCVFCPGTFGCIAGSVCRNLKQCPKTQ